MIIQRKDGSLELTKLLFASIDSVRPKSESSSIVKKKTIKIICKKSLKIIIVYKDY